MKNRSLVSLTFDVFFPDDPMQVSIHFESESQEQIDDFSEFMRDNLKQWYGSENVKLKTVETKNPFKIERDKYNVFAWEDADAALPKEDKFKLMLLLLRIQQWRNDNVKRPVKHVITEMEWYDGV